MTARTKQELYDYFCSGGSATNSISQIETEFEDLIDSLFLFGTWTDYSDTSTITGWSSYSEKTIEYKKIGSLVFVNFRLGGTSNATTASFSLPYASGQTGDPLYFCRSTDNGGSAVAAYGLVVSSTATLKSTSAGGSWTNSGTKAVYGQFFYEAA